MNTNTAICLKCGRTFQPSSNSSGKYCGQSCYHATPKNNRPLAERFWEKVYKTDNCWFWIGAPKGKGRNCYGHFRTSKRRLEAAHRVSWELHFGPIPQDKLVMHSCDNPQCVRPDHLSLGDLSANMRDMVAKGRKCPPDNRGEKHWNCKLTEREVLAIREDRKCGLKFREIAAKYNISQMAAWNAATGSYWKHIPFDFISS